MTRPTDTSTKREWTEGEVDGLIFRLLQRAYRRDNKTCRFIIEHLRAALAEELTWPMG